MNCPLTVVMFVGGVAMVTREVDDDDRLRLYEAGLGVWVLLSCGGRRSVDLAL